MKHKIKDIMTIWTFQLQALHKTMPDKMATATFQRHKVVKMTTDIFQPHTADKMAPGTMVTSTVLLHAADRMINKIATEIFRLHVAQKETTDKRVIATFFLQPEGKMMENRMMVEKMAIEMFHLNIADNTTIVTATFLLHVADRTTHKMMIKMF